MAVERNENGMRGPRGETVSFRLTVPVPDWTSNTETHETSNNEKAIVRPGSSTEQSVSRRRRSERMMRMMQMCRMMLVIMLMMLMMMMLVVWVGRQMREMRTRMQCRIPEPGMQILRQAGCTQWKRRFPATLITTRRGRTCPFVLSTACATAYRSPTTTTISSTDLGSTIIVTVDNAATVKVRVAASVLLGKRCTTSSRKRTIWTGRILFIVRLIGILVPGTMKRYGVIERTRAFSLFRMLFLVVVQLEQVADTKASTGTSGSLRLWEFHAVQEPVNETMITKPMKQGVKRSRRTETYKKHDRNPVLQRPLVLVPPTYASLESRSLPRARLFECLFIQFIYTVSPSVPEISASAVVVAVVYVWEIPAFPEFPHVDSGCNRHLPYGNLRTRDET
uniref:Uncharacterized protein n=1 Tax=Anopheles culicifacies TaxID=139723 RepID=A0A182MUN1_9DIPT